jgi:hypothetical protein
MVLTTMRNIVLLSVLLGLVWDDVVDYVGFQYVLHA